MDAINILPQLLNMIVSDNSDSDDAGCSTYRPTKTSSVNATEDPKSVDTLMAKEFLALSFQDRNAISEEIHGVSCLTPEETPELVNKSLDELEYEIGLLPAHETKMYTLSQTRYGRKNSSKKGGSYVNDVNFRVRFLRCELYDAARAAYKLVNYLESACDLFGEYALRRPIRLSDFNEEELQVFRTGNLQLLPFRDRSGRRIVAGVEGLGIHFDESLRVR